MKKSQGTFLRGAESVRVLRKVASYAGVRPRRATRQLRAFFSVVAMLFIQSSLSSFFLLLFSSSN